MEITSFCNHVNKLSTVGMDLAALDCWPSPRPPPRMQENPPCLQGGQFVVTKRATVVKKRATVVKKSGGYDDFLEDSPTTIF